MNKRKIMSGAMRFEVKTASLWDRINGPSVAGLFSPRTQAQRPESHFTTSAPVFYLKIPLINQNILLAGCFDQYKIVFDS